VGTNILFKLAAFVFKVVTLLLGQDSHLRYLYIYQFTHCVIPEDGSIHWHCCENFKISHKADNITSSRHWLLTLFFQKEFLLSMFM
jgi:hypothetical protein